MVFPRASLRAGRLKHNEIVIADRLVSGSHVLIEGPPDSASWRVRDLCSRNGTKVNGERCEVAVLRDGDVIALGSATVQVRFLELAEPSIADLRFVEGGDPMIRSTIEAQEPAGFPPATADADVEVLRRDYEKLRLAHELSLLASQQVDTDRMLAKVLSFCFQVLPVEHGVALLRDGLGKGLEVHAARSALPGESIPISRALLDRVLHSGEGLLLADALDSATRPSDSIHEGNIRSVIAAPILCRGAARGVLFLANCSHEHVFAERDLQLLVGMAAQVGWALERRDLAAQIEVEAERRAFLSRFLSPALVQQVRADRVRLEQRGELRTVAVLFADLRGFTRTSEILGPEDTVRMLNEHFEQLVQEVFRFGGVLDKFVGDALMAMWGAPVQRDDDALRALRCALSMQRCITALQVHRRNEDLPAQQIGVGVNVGQAVVGCMGSSMRADYTAIGPSVNLAHRLCSLAGPGEIWTSLATARSAGDRFQLESVAPVGVKGFAEPVEVCRVLSERP